jgi:hypothetical protein
LEESTLLTADFTEEEVKETIMQMERNNATGPNGLPMELYQNIWEVIKVDLMAMFVQLQTGELALFRWNFGVITLLPQKIRC